MRIPAWMLNQTVTIRPYLGPGAYETQYGEAVAARCRIEPRREVLMDIEGNEIVASARAFFAPDVGIPLGSEIVWEGTTHDVVEVMTQAGPNGQAHHIEAMLR